MTQQRLSDEELESLDDRITLKYDEFILLVDEIRESRAKLAKVEGLIRALELIAFDIGSKYQDSRCECAIEALKKWRGKG